MGSSPRRRGKTFRCRLGRARVGARSARFRLLSRREVAGAAAHQAGVLFIAAGCIGLATDFLAIVVGGGNAIVILIDSTNMAIGLITVRLPWRRWPERSVLVLPVAAFANIAATNITGTTPEATFGVWFVLVFVWIGMWQPPRTSYAMAPVAACAYLLPFALGVSSTYGTVASVAISIPVAVLVGETIARKAETTRRAEAGQEAALEALAKANVTDDLTGLGNRRWANSLLDTLQDGDALAILDLDHFKQVNDTLGHNRGDEVLHDLGMFLRNATRGDDSVARYGGEEFVVVLRQAPSGALEVIERLLADWRASGPLATLSAGIAVKRPGQSWSTTFSQADAALYQAKETGRDRAVLHQGEPAVHRPRPM
jgi:diguanylate cyclase (GGDEF)-like protein